MMRRSLVACLLAAAAALLVATPALAQGPVKIGVLTPLSPPGDAAAGQFIVRGAKMAADEINGPGGVLGGRKIELVIEDDSGTPEKGVAGLRKLASQDKVSAVIGQFHSSVMEAVQDLAEQLKIPVFSTQASAKRITEKHLTYTFRTHVIDPDPRAGLEPLHPAAGVQASGDHRREHRLRHRPLRRDQEAIRGERHQGGAQVDHLRPRRRRPHPAAPRDQELEARPRHQRGRGHAGVPDHQAGLRRRPVPRDADARLLRHAGAAGVLEEPGRQGRLHDVHRLLPSDHEAHAARRGLPHPVPRGVQGGAGLRRAQRLCPDHADRRRHQPREERQAGRHREGAPRQQVHGLERHHHLPARRGPVLAAVDAADAVHAVHEGRACPSPRPRSSSRPI